MRILSVLLAVGCASHPAPKGATIERAQREGYGGFVEATLLDGNVLSGELLAIDRNALWVMDKRNQTISVDLRNVKRADLYKYDYEGTGLGFWGVIGTLSTISHGFFLVFSFPIWLATSIVEVSWESVHMRIRYPDHSVDALRIWARFPQGMPASMRPVPKREQAWQLTQQAQAAARAGNCDSVLTLKPRVQELDADLHEVVFMRDEAIRRCLQLPSLLPAP